MAEDEGDADGLEAGDVVELAVEFRTPRGEHIDRDTVGIRDTELLLIGARTAPIPLERQLVGRSVGDEGRLERRPESGGDGAAGTSRFAPVEPIEDIVPEAIASTLDRAGITTPWEFLAVDAGELAEEYVMDASELERIQDEVRDHLSGRQLLEYELVDAWRWRSSGPDADGPPVWPTSHGDVANRRNADAVARLDGDEGRERWTFEPGDRVRSTPAIDGSVVYFGCDDGRVYGVDLLTGKQASTHERVSGFVTASRVESDIRSSPTIAAGALFVGSDDGTLMAIDLHSSGAMGEERWTYEMDGAVRTAPAVSDGVVFAGSGSELHAVDVETGVELWPRYFNVVGSGSPTTPAVADGTVYVGCSGYLYALDAERGRELWTVEFEGTSISDPAVDGDTVYVQAEEEVSALDAETGETRWRFRAAESDSVRAGPLVANDTVYAVDGETVHAIDDESGRNVWEYSLDDIAKGLCVALGRFYAVDRHQVYALDVASGDDLWTHHVSPSVQSSSVIAHETVFVGTRRGVIALDAV